MQVKPVLLLLLLLLLLLQVVATCKHFLGYGLEGAEGVSRCGTWGAWHGFISQHGRAHHVPYGVRTGTPLLPWQCPLVMKGMPVCCTMLTASANIFIVLCTCRRDMCACRYSHNVDLAPQDLADTDLPPFEACVQVRNTVFLGKVQLGKLQSANSVCGMLWGVHII
jgi:hypothetical protein